MMHLLSELKGKRVLDGADEEIGMVDGINMAYPEYRVPEIFIRVVGKELYDIRGRKTEFIPVQEIDKIEDAVHLFQDLKSLKQVIKEIHMEEYKEVFHLKELLREDIISFDGENIGKVEDIALGKRDRKMFLIIGGPKIKSIRGRQNERIPLDEVVSITEEVNINLGYEMLKRSILDR